MLLLLSLWTGVEIRMGVPPLEKIHPRNGWTALPDGEESPQRYPSVGFNTCRLYFLLLFPVTVRRTRQRPLTSLPALSTPKWIRKGPTPSLTMWEKDTAPLSLLVLRFFSVPKSSCRPAAFPCLHPRSPLRVVYPLLVQRIHPPGESNESGNALSRRKCGYHGPRRS